MFLNKYILEYNLIRILITNTSLWCCIFLYKETSLFFVLFFNYYSPNSRIKIQTRKNNMSLWESYIWINNFIYLLATTRPSVRRHLKVAFLIEWMSKCLRVFPVCLRVFPLCLRVFRYHLSPLDCLRRR